MTLVANMVMPKIEREAVARNYAKFVISPLERGYGVTLGNGLRRILFSSLEAQPSPRCGSAMYCTNSAISPAFAKTSFKSLSRSSRSA